MSNNNDIYYSAYTARDRRFDGIFFIGVLTTKIYCRPICPSKTPLRKNCVFFESIFAAENKNFRPCLRCRPELAPGNAPADDSKRIAYQIIQRLEDGIIEKNATQTEIADHFELSTRQIRRILQKEIGISPHKILQTQRLLLAKQLLSETKLSITEIAFTSGFSSIRRFNDVFKEHYRMQPSQLRKTLKYDSSEIKSNDTSQIFLCYRPPYNWDSMITFLKGRELLGVEYVTKEKYMRTVKIGKYEGWISLSHTPENSALRLEFSHSLCPVLPILLNKIRNMFDLQAHPEAIQEKLKKCKIIGKAVLKNPGMRLPGGFDGFELCLRAILGQQVTVKAATTLAGRLSQTYGKSISTPYQNLTHLTPLAETISKCKETDITKFGITNTRANTIISLAKAYTKGTITLDVGSKPQKAIESLLNIPGIGPWTSQYIVMRGIGWPNAFLKEDLVVRKKLGNVSIKTAEDISQQWAPWRSYAVLHIWNSL